MFEFQFTFAARSLPILCILPLLLHLYPAWNVVFLHLVNLPFQSQLDAASFGKPSRTAPGLVNPFSLRLGFWVTQPPCTRTSPLCICLCYALGAGTCLICPRSPVPGLVTDQEPT